MKHLFLVLHCFLSLCCFGQFDKSTNLSATGNFNIALKGLGYTEIGLGGGLAASFFSKRKLQAVIETQAARFKDNMDEYDIATGEIARTAVYIIGLGPQYFINKEIALSVTSGPSWHTALDTEYHFGYGFQYSVTGFWGGKKHLITKIFMVHIPTKESTNIYGGPILYLGLSAGYRFD